MKGWIAAALTVSSLALASCGERPTHMERWNQKLDSVLQTSESEPVEQGVTRSLVCVTASAKGGCTEAVMLRNSFARSRTIYPPGPAPGPSQSGEPSILPYIVISDGGRPVLKLSSYYPLDHKDRRSKFANMDIVVDGDLVVSDSVLVAGGIPRNVSFVMGGADIKALRLISADSEVLARLSTMGHGTVLPLSPESADLFSSQVEEILYIYDVLAKNLPAAN